MRLRPASGAVVAAIGGLARRRVDIMIGFIIVVLIVGLIAGFVARAVVPGDDSMSVGATTVLGAIGAIVALLV